MGNENMMKAVVLGDYGVGRTSLIIRYCYSEFSDDTPQCIPCVATSVKIDHENVIDIEFWDPTGGEDFKALRPLSYDSTDVFILVFSVVCPASFCSITENWLPEVKCTCPGVPLVVVGLQIDLRTNFKVLEKLRSEGKEPTTFKEGSALARRIGAEIYLECSALMGEGVDQVFQEAAKVGLKFFRKRMKESNKCCVLL